MKTCRKCGQTKDWCGSDIKCPFQTSDKFGDNWRCGIIDKIRDLCNLAMDGKDLRLQYQFCNDDKYVTIKTDDIEDDLGLCLWISYYKSRGRTDAMWILDGSNAPRVPTFDELNKIIEYYSCVL